MGTTWVENSWMESIQCCTCGTLFAMSKQLLDRFRAIWNYVYYARALCVRGCVAFSVRGARAFRPCHRCRIRRIEK